MFKPEDKRKVILASETQGAIDTLIEQCQEGEIDYNVLEVLMKNARGATSAARRADKNYVPKYYIGLEVALTAYERMLEVGGTVDDVLCFAAEECEEDIELILGAKHRPFFYSRSVVEEAEKHPVQKAMVRGSHIDKKSLKASKTVSQQLRRLSVYVNLHNRITELEERVDDLQGRTIIQEATTNVQSKRLDLLDKLTGSGYDAKHTAQELYLLGYSNKQIAEVVKKNPKTIGRWIKEYKDEQGN
mgnify:CR=1 FL=1